MNSVAATSRFFIPDVASSAIRCSVGVSTELRDGPTFEGRDHAFVGGRAGAILTEQHAVECDALQMGQTVEDRGFDADQQVGQHGERESGLGRSGTCREHPKAALVRLFQSP
jgi:hypothetical protein